jgi:hypothetical protein
VPAPEGAYLPSTLRRHRHTHGVPSAGGARRGGSHRGSLASLPSLPSLQSGVGEGGDDELLPGGVGAGGAGSGDGSATGDSGGAPPGPPRGEAAADADELGPALARPRIASHHDLLSGGSGIGEGGPWHPTALVTPGESEGEAGVYAFGELLPQPALARRDAAAPPAPSRLLSTVDLDAEAFATTPARGGRADAHGTPAFGVAAPLRALLGGGDAGSTADDAAADAAASAAVVGWAELLAAHRPPSPPSPAREALRYAHVTVVDCLVAPAPGTATQAHFSVPSAEPLLVTLASVGGG